MQNKTTQKQLITGCLVVCAVMIGLIGNSFRKEPIKNEPLPAGDSAAGSVTVNRVSEPESVFATPAPPTPAPVAVKTDSPIPDTDKSENKAVSTGTEQTIQNGIEKPEFDEDTLSDPARMPDGTPVEQPPEHEDHDSVVAPPPQSQPADSNGGSTGKLPGFDNVPYGGPNHGETLNDMYENGNKIGIM